MCKASVRRGVALLVAAFTLLGVVACGSKKTETARNNVPETSSAGQNKYYSKYDKPVKAKVAMMTSASTLYPKGQSLEDNIWTRLYKEALNLDVEIAFTADTYDQYKTKLNLNLASGNVVDIFIVPLDKYVSLQQSDAMEDITKLYASVHPAVKSAMDYNPKMMDALKLDGKVYGIPQYIPPDRNIPLLWVRAGWMDKVGKKDVKTIDDIISLAEDFTTKDPDGNGKNDTYGFGITKDLYGFQFFTNFFMNAFNAYPTIWQEKNSQLVYGSVQPEVKNALGKLADLYKKGAVDREFGVKANTQVLSDFTAGKFGMYFATCNNANTNKNLKNANPDLEMRVFNVRDSAGQYAKGTVIAKSDMIWVVRKGYEYPDALIKLLNIRMDKLSEEGFDENFYRIVEDGTIFDTHMMGARILVFDPYESMNGSEQIVKKLNASETDSNGLKGMAKFNFESIMSYKKNPKDIIGWMNLITYGPGGAYAQNLRQIMDKKLFVDDEFYGVPGNVMIDNWATLQKMENETFIKIIYGAMPLNDFDKFVENWNKLGGSDVTKEVNEWYKKKK